MAARYERNPSVTIAFGDQWWESFSLPDLA